MGVVYLAEDSKRRQVALKLVRSELADDPAFRSRFRREVQTARRVGGICTTRYVDADVESDRPYLVTEYVEGGNLSPVRLRARAPCRGALSYGRLSTVASAIFRQLRSVSGSAGYQWAANMIFFTSVSAPIKAAFRGSPGTPALVRVMPGMSSSDDAPHVTLPVERHYDIGGRDVQQQQQNDKNRNLPATAAPLCRRNDRRRSSRFTIHAIPPQSSLLEVDKLPSGFLCHYPFRIDRRASTAARRTS